MAQVKDRIPVKTILWIAAIGLILGTVYGISPNTNPEEERGSGAGIPAREDKEDKIIVEIHFDPDRRAREMIFMIATVEGVVIDRHKPTKSSYIKAHWIPKRAEIIVNVWQMDAGIAGCALSHKGEVRNKAGTTEIGPNGMATCRYRST